MCLLVGVDGDSEDDPSDDSGDGSDDVGAHRRARFNFSSSPVEMTVFLNSLRNLIQRAYAGCMGFPP